MGALMRSLSALVPLSTGTPAWYSPSIAALTTLRTHPRVASLLQHPDATSSQLYFDLVAAVAQADEEHATGMQLPRADEGLFHTHAHVSLVDKLITMSTTLADGDFYQRGDVASVTLLGPRGIGKTTSLLAFGTVVPLALPNVLPIYINCSNEAAYGRRLAHTLAMALRAHGVSVTRADIGGVAEALKHAKKFALVLLDEVDKLYEHPLPWSHHIHLPAARTLHDLVAIGEHRSGRFSTLLCGSSGMLTDLITANVKTDVDALGRFPLLAHAINLNDSKFREHRVYYGSSLNVAHVGAMLGLPSDTATWTDAQRAHMRLVTFVAGTTARNVTRVVTPRGRRKEVMPEEVLALYVGSADAGRKTRFQADTMRVWKSVMVKLWHKNKALMETLSDRDSHVRVKVDAVESVAWERTFQGLSANDLHELADQVSMTPEAFHHRLVHLYDRDWLSFGDSADAVYPYIMMHLVNFHHRELRMGAPAGTDTSAAGMARALTSVNKWLKEVATGALREGGKAILQSAL